MIAETKEITMESEKMMKAAEEPERIFEIPTAEKQVKTGTVMTDIKTQLVSQTANSMEG